MQLFAIYEKDKVIFSEMLATTREQYLLLEISIAKIEG